ncbi:Response regulator protein vraR [Nocardiopsis dassonvillei]|uniref:Two component transcriptional regulator, LuxR family n=1 Tax=Nocardiopsis dassonvillei (strain ATCC 23218 / DSM 43111 / CIP 107115 / JCM 7437 / KCTC 9190 / NBRC 14626 / NCTC 10488 / NRRL B-5397 / IMRU 509) TaxID=446468 RepID=D7AZ94_NOCDD|nr:two component transcriptional regulator, LuxR family [Nocardiopsis dassonvillei subsp. dassonvillei DSM 43111]VEI90589.1 Response regulator protein vraR [Nocardiopsis dassonvillei]
MDNPGFPRPHTPEVSHEKGTGPLITRVLIIGDQDVVRLGLCTAFEATQDIKVVGTTGDLRVAVARARQLRPDVAVVDMAALGERGNEVVRELSELDDPRVRVLALAVPSDRDNLVSCLRAGACGYILTGSDMSVITDAVRSLREGHTVLDPAVVGTVVEEFVRYEAAVCVGADDPDSCWKEQFTDREKDVVALVATGASNAEIAGVLGLSETTIKSHVSSVLAKRGLRNRVQLVVWAFRSGLVPVRGRDAVL